MSNLNQGKQQTSVNIKISNVRILPPSPPTPPLSGGGILNISGYLKGDKIG